MLSSSGSNSSEDLLFHHCITLDAVRFGTLRPDRKYSDTEFLPAYEWVEEITGFFPIFYAVGEIDAVVTMTGYADNWRNLTGGEMVNGRYQKTYNRKGNFPNLAAFSFDTIDGIFMDFQSWHIALNACMNGGSVTPAEQRMIFKPSWTRSRWIRAALNGTHSVQLVAPELPLTLAKRGYVRNSKTKRIVERMGFPDITVKRVKVTSIL
ncbi:MAG: hypothetical protein Q7T80_06135 [Methanoregula sp.]|nr:hypothetical protein [Methanoregula sp.]